MNTSSGNRTWRRVVPGVLALCMALSMTASAGGGKSAKLFRDFDPARVPRRPSGASAPVARMLDAYITLDSLGGPAAGRRDQMDRLVGRILGPVLREYAAVERIEVTPQEVEGLIRAVGNDAAGQVSEQDREFAREYVRQWKVNGSLYRRYGGVVIYQQLDPLEPIGAYRALLEEMRKRKVFEIYDRGLSDGFWERLADRSFEIPPEYVDFDTPFWLKPRPAQQEPPPRAAQPPATGPARTFPTPAECYAIAGGSVRFLFDPAQFEHATSGTTGEWASLRNLRIVTVCLAGDFNGWSATGWVMRPVGPAGAVYLLERRFDELGGSGRHEFKFVVNGGWWVEPGARQPNRRETGLGNQSSNLEVVVP